MYIYIYIYIYIYVMHIRAHVCVYPSIHMCVYIHMISMRTNMQLAKPRLAQNNIIELNLP